MSDEVKTGGPAFPTTAGQVVYSNGMTLRDWFATSTPIGDYEFPNAKAMADFIGEDAPSIDDYDAIFALAFKVESKLRYMRADAMLEERKK